MTNKADHVEELLEGVEAMKEQWHKDFDSHAKGVGFGTTHMTDAQHVAWVFDMMKRYPPDGTLRPDGTPVTVSPWLEALLYVEDGVKELRRFNRTMLRLSMGETNG